MLGLGRSVSSSSCNGVRRQFELHVDRKMADEDEDEDEGLEFYWIKSTS